MWYLVAGKIMSLITFLIFNKTLSNIDDLIFLDRFIGWFLIEHVYEDYFLTSGKFFIINEDFRTLVKNFVVIIRNFIFLAQVFTPMEFFLINLVLVFVLVFNNKKSRKNVVISLVVISYFLVLNSFLFFNFSFMLIFIKNVFISWFGLLFYFYILCLYLVYSPNKHSYEIFVKLNTLKISFVLLLIICLCVCVFGYVSYAAESSNNFIQELSLKMIIPYLYVYCC